MVCDDGSAAAAQRERGSTRMRVRLCKQGLKGFESRWLHPMIGSALVRFR